MSKPGVKKIRKVEDALWRLPFDCVPGGKLQIQSALYALRWVLTGEETLEFGELLRAIEDYETKI